jgi:hypothetical protein
VGSECCARRCVARYDDILQTVDRTPVVRMHRLGPNHVELCVKLEARNPMGSVTDRMAVGIIDAAERSGTLAPGQTVVEATSGNTGIGLAMVCARRGHPLVIGMAENFSISGWCQSASRCLNAPVFRFRVAMATANHRGFDGASLLHRNAVRPTGADAA